MIQISKQSVTTQRAAHFSRHAHEGQVRRHTGEPYYLHPFRVAARVSMLKGATQHMIAAAFLHDVVEDTKTSLEEIGEYFGATVARMVAGLTNASLGMEGVPRARRKMIDLEFLVTQSDEVKQIKLADRIDNLRDMEEAPSRWKKIYCSESRDLARALRSANPDLADELLNTCDRLEGVIK